MPKRRRLLTTPMKNKAKLNKSRDENDTKEREVSTARGRLKGALMEVLEPTGDESDASTEQSPTKRERRASQDHRKDTSEDEERNQRKRSPPRQSYVLKLFDRSVDLSQFKEDSSLYPICRAWIANQPKVNYSDFGKKYNKEPEIAESIELPNPEGPPVSRIPSLLPEQMARSKDNINLNYVCKREAPPPSKEQLLLSHTTRWAAVRRAWLNQAAAVEARYASTQQLLNKINVNAL